MVAVKFLFFFGEGRKERGLAREKGKEKQRFKRGRKKIAVTKGWKERENEKLERERDNWSERIREK
jgi:FtsZ-binding cell division protein ZapB